MSGLIIFITIFGGIIFIGFVVAIVVFINKRRKRLARKNLTDEEAQLSIEEQYRRVYGDE